MSGLDWAEIKTTLEECVRNLLPLPAAAPSFEPRWQYDSNGNAIAEIATGWKTFLRVVSVAETGNARRYVENESDPNRLDEEIVLRRLMAVEFRCEADFHDEDAARWAVKVVECVKAGFRLRSTLDKLNASGMAIAEFLDTLDVSFEHDGRWVNAYTTDLFFNVVGCYSTADLPSGVDWFNRVEVSSCILRPGDETPDPKINFTDKLIGPPA